MFGTGSYIEDEFVLRGKMLKMRQALIKLYRITQGRNVELNEDHKSSLRELLRVLWNTPTLSESQLYQQSNRIRHYYSNEQGAATKVVWSDIGMKLQSLLETLEDETRAPGWPSTDATNIFKLTNEQVDILLKLESTFHYTPPHR